MVFSLADLGVGLTAIIYAMYKPVAERDTHKIQALMNMYGRAYRTIGMVIIGMGLAMTPFIRYLVKTDQDIPDLPGDLSALCGQYGIDLLLCL